MKTYLFIFTAALAMIVSSCGGSPSTYQSTKAERNLIRKGNKEFADSNYIAAARLYNDAIAAAPGSEPARFNATNALSRYVLQKDEKERDSTMNVAKQAYENLLEFGKDKSIREKAAYNLGNLAFHAGNYKESIEYYKAALRLNPDNFTTRENLLVALIKDQNDDQQDQDQDQNQDQQDQEQQQDQQQQKEQQQQEQQQQEMSANAEQILQTMQNRENQTREETNKQPAPAQRTTDKPW